MERYLPLKSESSRLADEYYSCLSKSLTKPNGPSIDECLRTAREYRTALREQLSDLKRLGDSPFIRRERELASRYLELVEHDLETLKHGQIPKTQNQSGRKLDH